MSSLLKNQESSFASKKYKNRTYAEIVNTIIKRIGLLKEEFPHFAGIEPIEEKIYRSSEQFNVHFLYEHNIKSIPNPNWEPYIKTPREILVPASDDGIYISIQFKKEDKYIGQRVVLPYYIGDMQIIIDIICDNVKIRERIFNIFQEEGMELKNK
jgi:hypothetical protein